MHWVRTFLAVLALSVLAACASHPAVERLQGESLPSPDIVGSKFVVVDARTTARTADQSIDTALGTGKRIDESVISPPPIASFIALFRQALASQQSRVGTETIAISEFGVGTVRGRGKEVDVFNDPGARGAAAGAGPYGLPAMLIVQLFEQSRQDSKAPTYFGTVAQLRMGELRVSCEGLAVYLDANASQSWRESVQKAANDCAEKLVAAFNASKPADEKK